MQQAIFRVSGSDADSFLQGQITNDVTLLTDQKALFAGYCDPKGRLLATLLLANWQGQRYLLLPEDIAETTLKRLRMFVMRADVLFTAVEGLKTGFISTNQQSANSLWSCEEQGKEGFTIQLPGNHQLIAGKTDWVAKQRDSIEASKDSPDHELAMIDAYLPEISLATSGQCIPQTVDLDQHEGVSFNKGCYTGQEIIARLHFRGTPSRRLRRFLLSPTAPQPKRGDAITNNDGAAQGIVIRAAKLADGRHKLLASVRLKSLDTDLQLHGQPLELLDD